MLKKLITLYILLAMLGGSLMAQSYGWAMGLRLSNDKFKRNIGISSQYRVLKRFTIEGIIQSDFQDNHTLHGMFQWHHPLVSKRLNFYSGAGLSLGFEESREVDPITKNVIITTGNPTLGTDLIAGIEFTLLKYAISLDYKPNFNFVGREPWYIGQTGVSARAVILTGAKQNRKKRQKHREKRRDERQENFQRNQHGI